MLPKTHIILGLLFSIIIWVLFPSINLIYLLLIFLSSFLIDFDHYITAVMHNKSLSLSAAYKRNLDLGRQAAKEKAKGIRKKGSFHIFHTLEFLLLTYILSYIWQPFLYIFIGMIFHSILDVIYQVNSDLLYRREYLLVNWIRRQF